MMITEVQLADERRQEFEAAVRQSRLVREALGPQPPTVVRVMRWTGQHMVSLGQSLQARAEATTSAQARPPKISTYRV